MSGHHLVLGKLTDYVTGDVLDDTHDERYRQDLARLLVQEKGYEKSDIEPRRELVVTACDKRAVIKVDFVIWLRETAAMIIKYAPGSIVTRHRPSLGISRLLEPYQIPVVVVTNGETAEILDGPTGKVLASGLGGIPDKSALLKKISAAAPAPVSEARAERESRIVFAFEVDGTCPCDDNICIL